MPIVIEEWEWDDANLNECGRHGLTPKRVRQVAEEAPRFRPNKAGRASTHQMMGPDHGGELWVVCILQILGKPGLWRAVTGWRANALETAWYRRRA